MTPKKVRVYVETSVWNFVFADDAPTRRDATRRFFEEVRKGAFEVFLSDVVLDEIKAAPEPRRSELDALIGEIGPKILDSSDETDELAASLLAGHTIPDKYDNDAKHIAIAVVENMDVLLSWNFKHIVKMTTRRVVAATSRLNGYKEIEIATPEEVIDDDSE